MGSVACDRAGSKPRLPTAFFAIAVVLAPTVARAAVPSPWQAERWLTFGDAGRRWVLVEAHSRAMRMLVLPEPFQARELVATPSGNDIFFTAMDPILSNVTLFRWSPPEAPVRIGDVRGFHSDPSPTPDGQWVYFAHNPDTGSGPMGGHERQAWAQIYRVRRDGTGLTALTAEPGCHIAPVAGVSRLFFVHTDCRVRRWLETRRLSEAERPGQELRVADERFGEPAVSPDGRRLLFSTVDRLALTISELDLGMSAQPSAPRVVTRFERTAPRARPQFGASPDVVFYQSQDAVWSFGPSGVVRLAGI